MTYLAIGTLVVWVAIFLYTLSLASRQRKLQQRLEELSHALDEKRG